VRAPARLEGLTTRAALLLGFGLTLMLWLVAGYLLAGRIADVRQESDAINRRYMHAQELLTTVRAQVLLGAVYVRDALLDPKLESAAEHRRLLEGALRQVDDALAEYEPIFDEASESKQIAELREQIDDFRASVFAVLESDSTRWPTDAQQLLRSRIMPRRESIVRVSDEVQALNRASFVQQQQATSQVYEAMQRRLLAQFGFALAANFLIGLLATRHVASLETRLREQQLRDAANTRDLQRLSAQLITAQEEERRTIARELHDEVGQVLTAIKVELAVAERRIASAGGSPMLLAEARTITEGALHTVRDLSRLLHPALLDDLGLPAAVEACIRDFRKRYDVSVELLQERMERRLPQATEAAAYRIIQEALTNVVRHARAGSCRVYLQRLVNTVLITIEDDGIGFETEKSLPPGERPGLGLLGIRERAGQLRGTVRIESAAGRGTRITIELPAPDEPAAGAADPPAATPEATGTVHA
jgi:signal transduction histidine kinase